MKVRNRRREESSALVELGRATSDTLGLPYGDIIEPMGLWTKTGLSDR